MSPPRLSRCSLMKTIPFVYVICFEEVFQPSSENSIIHSRLMAGFLSVDLFGILHFSYANVIADANKNKKENKGRGNFQNSSSSKELAGASSSSPVMIARSTKELYKQHCPSSLTRNCWIRLSSIVQDSPCCSPWESRPCLNPSVADHLKRPAKHHRFGQPKTGGMPSKPIHLSETEESGISYLRR
ncbi:hypothetical protein Vadar_010861 [Vaccinium darrowii]|uniref:Uncharacterized protein n=1 Tax=Vaccinium darrowii TaxID=229202 RepID=A0ACB7WZN2_9ERIC|nr:hypothetical protein Vadar_010861 [Vaccinium darrowii]